MKVRLPGSRTLRRLLTRRSSPPRPSLPTPEPPTSKAWVAWTELFRGPRGRVFLTSHHLDRFHAPSTADLMLVLRQLRPEDHLVWLTSWHSTRASYEEAADIYRSVPFSLRHIWVLANQESEVEAARLAGFRASWVHHNCWIDASCFRPYPTAQKQYGAVLITQPVRHKRPWLASKTRDLAIIEGRLFHMNEREDLTSLPHKAHFQSIQPVEVSDIIRASFAGLALSPVEGGCRAASEYLMCGVPVVSTPSLGGRDVFFDEYNSIIAEADPDAIADAVERLIRDPRDPVRISREHEARAAVHRERFMTDIVGPIQEELGIPKDLRDASARQARSRMSPGGGLSRLDQALFMMQSA